jgi:hypothetical protein
MSSLSDPWDDPGALTHGLGLTSYRGENMRGTKKIRVALLATTLLGGLLVAVQPAVAEPSSTISLKPINTKCTDKKDLIKWVGGQ